ncbi:MAG: glycosyltransferase family 4 protein [Spirochaetales bacterium]|nr:glycosyltransferase family 4 protein [Spirochaetales bacterium]
MKDDHMNTLPLKICVICDMRNIHCKRWVTGLKSRGHNVFVLSEQEGDIDGVPVKTLNPPPYLLKMFPDIRKMINLIYRRMKASRVRKILLQENPDIVYGHFLTNHGWLAITTDYHPVVIIAYGSDILLHPNRYLIDRFIVKRSLQRADGTISVADHMRKRLIEFNCPPDRLKIIQNAVDTRLFNTEGRVLRNYQKPISNAVLISTRAMRPIYNLELLIRALPHIVNTFPHITVIIVGKGKGKSKLELLAKKLGVYESIQFMAPVIYTKMPSLFKKADIFVSPSRSDGLCVALLESIACGAFPIVSNIPGNRELIHDGINGYLFPINNPMKLAKAVINTIKNPQIIKNAMEKNTKMIQERYTESRQIKETEDFFYHIINKRKLWKRKF